jgi:hypothetical protein
MGCVTRVYGFAFSLGVPVRALYANALNAAATLSAVARYTRSKVTREPLRWLKTEHSYPSRVALLEHKRQLGEILIDSGFLSADALDRALRTRPAGLRLGEHLVACGDVGEETLYLALGLQQGLPLTPVEAFADSGRIVRILPKEISREWRVLPFKIAADGLSVASPDLPTAALTQQLQNFTEMEVHFHLVTPTDYEHLSATLL